MNVRKTDSSKQDLTSMVNEMLGQEAAVNEEQHISGRAERSTEGSDSADYASASADEPETSLQVPHGIVQRSFLQRSAGAAEVREGSHR